MSNSQQGENVGDERKEKNNDMEHKRRVSLTI